MRIKTINDEIKVMSFGIISEGTDKGKPFYVLLPEIKQVEIGGVWIDNPGFDGVFVDSQEKIRLEEELLSQTIRAKEAGILFQEGKLSQPVLDKINNVIADIEGKILDAKI